MLSCRFYNCRPSEDPHIYKCHKDSQEGDHSIDLSTHYIQIISLTINILINN